MDRLKHSNLKIIALIAVLVGAPLTYVVANQLQPAYHGVGVMKSASPYAAIGANITYSIKVYNPSDFDLYKINVTDEMLGFGVTIPFMSKGNMTGVTYVLNRTALASDLSPLVNTVSVEAVNLEGVYSTSSTQAKTVIERLIDVEKTGPLYAHRGEAIMYTIVVKNLANSTLWNATVKDEMIGFSWKGDLAVKESNEFNITYIVPMDAEDPLVNKVVAAAKFNESTILDEATWSVDLLNPKLKVDKTVKPSVICAGENVTYTIKVTNVGDTRLFNLTLIDSIYGPAPKELVPLNLSVWESFTWSFNATISKCTVNMASATGFDIMGMKVSSSDKAFVEVKPKYYPQSIGYWKNHPENWPVDKIAVGNVSYTKEEAIDILKEANAKDATRMLAAQLIAAKLNRLMGASPHFYCHCKAINIDEVISDADNFLIKHTIGSDPKGYEKQLALWLKDILDAYNNSRYDD